MSLALRILINCRKQQKNGIMEKKMETTIAYWGYIGMMKEKNGSYYLRFTVYGFMGY